jgi:pyruvate dehydrogenase (quinone)
MAETAADILVGVLRAWDVQLIFGLPGDGINGVMEALRRRKNEIRFIQVRHEEAAAFMACANETWPSRPCTSRRRWPEASRMGWKS